MNQPKLSVSEKVAVVLALVWPVVFVAVLSLVTGCMRSITIVRHAGVPSTNGVTSVDGGWQLDYCALGLKTDVSSIKAKRTTDGGIEVEIDGVATDVSARNAEIIEASGGAAGTVAGKVVEAVK